MIKFRAPDLGRWLHTDPIGFSDGKNLYRFVANSPVGLTDSSGLICDAESAAVQSATQAVAAAVQAYGYELIDVTFAAGATVGALGTITYAAQRGSVLGAVIGASASLLGALNTWYQVNQADVAEQRLKGAEAALL